MSQMITPEELAAGAAAATLLASEAAVATPMLAVDLDAGLEECSVERAVAAASASDRLLVGVGRRPLSPSALALAAALDTTLAATVRSADRAVVRVADPESALEDLRAAIASTPHAALVLGQVLKLSQALSVPDAIDIESFAYSTLLGAPEFQRWLAARGPRPLPPPSPQEPVRIARDGDRLRVTLNRPERRNAYGAQVRDGLVAALELVAADDTIAAVVVDGAGPSFSAGGDLDEFGTTPDPVTAHLIRTRAGAARLVARLADRIEAQVHGSCVGAGIEVPAFAGRIVAAPGTVFRLPEVSMGLIPGAGGTVSVPRRIGRWRTFWLGVTGSALDARTALEWGLIDEIAAAR